MESVRLVGENEGEADVFISYSSKNKDIADAVVAEYEQHGIRCWYAPRDIMPGDEWVSAIHEAIKNCRLFVLIYTEPSNASKQVANEVALAFNSEKKMIPFKLSDVTMSNELEYYLTRVHWLDAVNTPLSEGVVKLREYSEVILKGGTPKEAGIRNGYGAGKDTSRGGDPGRSEAEGKNASGSPKNSGPVLILAIAAVLLMLGIGIFLWVKFGGGAGNGPEPGTKPHSVPEETLTEPISETDTESVPSTSLQSSETEGESSEESPEISTVDSEELYERAATLREQGDEESVRKALELYLEAAEAGNDKAYNSLGNYYLEQDAEKKSNGEGKADVEYEGIMISEDLNRAIGYFGIAVEHGDSTAMYNLGLVFENANDLYSVTPDLGKALEYYKKADESGHTGAHSAVVRLSEQ